MPQVSKIKLDPEIENNIFTAFFNSFAKTTEKQTIEKFLDNLLTQTEKIMLAKRFAAALLIHRNYPTDLISYTLKLSRTTIGTVRREIEKRGEGYRAIFKLADYEILHKKTEFSRIFQKIEELIDIASLPMKGSPSSIRRWKNR